MLKKMKSSLNSPSHKQSSVRTGLGNIKGLKDFLEK